MQPLDWQLHEYELSNEYSIEGMEVPQSRAVELTPRKWRLPSEFLLEGRPAPPLDRQIDDEDEPSPECSTDIVERPESSEVVCDSSSKSRRSLLAARAPQAI